MAYRAITMTKKMLPKARADFALRLRMAREADYPTAKSFAGAIGVEDETYRMWERGDREPDITNMVKIASKLRISLDFLIMGDLPKLPSQDPQESTLV